MRIMQVPVRFYPYIGGTEQLCFYLSKELVRRGHEVKVICANEPPAEDGIIEGIQVRRLPYRFKIANTNITSYLYRELLRSDFDIIHTHLPHPWSADISVSVARKKNKPLFLTYHNDITGRGINRFIAGCYNFTALKFVLRQAQKIFITRGNYIQYSSFLRPFAQKIVVTPPGVNLDKFRPMNLTNDTGKHVIFFLSRLDRFHRYKGLEYLLQAVKKIKDKFPIQLNIGGEGELMEYYKMLAKEYGLQDFVAFLGKLQDEQLVKCYNLCDVFVLPSVSATQEGFGLVALEAMACKKPIIVTEIVGVAEEVKINNFGLVVKSSNVDELSHALEYLLSHKDKAREMGEKAYATVRNKYTWENHVDIVENEYKKAIRVY